MSGSEPVASVVTRFVELEGRGMRHSLLLAALALLVAFGLYAAQYMEQSGHHVTGMSNQVVWGLPHVFAVFLIIAASGALNVASMACVFGQAGYKPLARLSVLVAVSLLVGGLFILVLDLGRPDRLVVALTHYNFKSIFAWNIVLYSGFVLVALFYLWTLMEGRLQKHSRFVGGLALFWRLILTTGTGCIFGFLVARPLYHVAVMAPLFVSLSLSFGLASFMLIFFAIQKFRGSRCETTMQERLAKLLSLLVWTAFCLMFAQYVFAYFSTTQGDVARFVLLSGDVYTVVFWFGQVGIGTLVPLMLLHRCKRRANVSVVMVSAAMVVAGGFAQLYVLILAGQALPLRLFPGKLIVESSFFDGAVATYVPSVPELGLGIGGIAFALFCICTGLKVLRLLPDVRSGAGVA
jgi:Ni/Fe-hydrogenase subunit HybB-like protein